MRIDNLRNVPQNGLCIEMTGVGKRFGSHWALTSLNLKIRRGESVALFGANGSGKSTLLRILATLLQPSRGHFRVFDRDPGKEKIGIRKKVRLLGHDKQLYEMLTVTENLRLAAGLYGLENGEGSFDAIYERLEIGSYKNQRVGDLSEGMKKRVVVARLLLGEPDLFLLDEPHPALDGAGRKILDELIQEWRRRGKTLLLAGHDHGPLLSHADRLLILHEGGWHYDGPVPAKGNLPFS